MSTTYGELRTEQEKRIDAQVLARVKRDWVPGFLWRAFCVGNIATFFPWNVVLTRKTTP